MLCLIRRMKAFESLFAVIMIVSSMSCIGQVKIGSYNVEVANIEDFINQVNSDESLIEAVSEGIIDYEGQSGGFETYHLYDPTTKELFRTRYNEATDTTLNFIIYYNDNEVLYVKAEKGLWKNGEYTEIFNKTAYFKNGTTLREEGSGLKPSGLLIIGEQYLKRYAEDFDEEKIKN